MYITYFVFIYNRERCPLLGAWCIITWPKQCSILVWVQAIGDIGGDNFLRSVSTTSARRTYLFTSNCQLAHRTEELQWWICFNTGKPPFSTVHIIKFACLLPGSSLGVVSHPCCKFCPTKSKCSMCILDLTQSSFFCFRKFMTKLADDQFPSVTKGHIFTISNIQP